MKVVSLSSSFVVEAAAAGKAWNRGNGFGGEAFKSLRWVAKKQWFPAPQAHHCDCSSLVRGVQKPPNKNHREWWWWRCFLVLLHYYSGLFCSAQLDYSNNRFSTCLLASVSDFLYLDTKMVTLFNSISRWRTKSGIHSGLLQLHQHYQQSLDLDLSFSKAMKETLKSSGIIIICPPKWCISLSKISCSPFPVYSKSSRYSPIFKVTKLL